MLRYMVFVGLTYYPNGGWEDYKASHEELEDAMGACHGYDWWQVVDTVTGEVRKGSSYDLAQGP